MYLSFNKKKIARYVVLISIKVDFDLCDKDNIPELLDRLSAINGTIDRVAISGKEVLFSSAKRDAIGFVIASNLTAKAIADTFLGNTTIVQTACLFRDDTVFVTEIGDDESWYPIGASRAWTFLQRNKED